MIKHINISNVVLSALDYNCVLPFVTYKAYDCDECLKHRKFDVLTYNAPDQKSEVRCTGCGAVFLIERKYL